MKATGEYYRSKPYNSKYYSSEDSKMKKRFRDNKRRSLLRRSGHKISKNDVEYIRKINKNCCHYCGKTCNDDYAIDHMIPLSRGGTSNVENLTLSCVKCNSSKGTMTSEEFFEKIKRKNIQRV